MYCHRAGGLEVVMYCAAIWGFYNNFFVKVLQWHGKSADVLHTFYSRNQKEAYKKFKEYKEGIYKGELFLETLPKPPAGLPVEKW